MVMFRYENLQMDAVVKSPTIASCHWTGINSNITKRLTIRFPPSKTKCNLHSNKMEIQRHNIKNNVLKKSWHRDRISPMASKGSDKKSWQNSLSPAQIVDQYYTCINDKELRQLEEYISEDACFDDYTFTKPFYRKEEIMRFLGMLTDGMGRNVKFKVTHIYEGDDLTAVASWHLEWNMKQIPFTRGCTFFKLSKEGQNLTIWRADVLIESPIKPGGVVLTILKKVTSIFDDFPRLTEWFLRSPQAILTWISKIYNIFVTPWLNPLLSGYIAVWAFFIRLLNSAITVAIFISKIFFK